MSESIIIEIGQNALFIILKIIAPVVGIGLITGLIVAIFQATTQIQEQTLTFIPKIIAVFISIAVFGPWMLRTLMDYIIQLFSSIPQFIG